MSFWKELAAYSVTVWHFLPKKWLLTKLIKYVRGLEENASSPVTRELADAAEHVLMDLREKI